MSDEEYGGDYGYEDEDEYGGYGDEEGEYGDAADGGTADEAPPAKNLHPTVLGRQMSYELHEPTDTETVMQQRISDFCEFLDIDSREDAAAILEAGGWDV